MIENQEKSLDLAVTNSKANDECHEATSSANNIAENTKNSNLTPDEKMRRIKLESAIAFDEIISIV